VFLPTSKTPILLVEEYTALSNLVGLMILYSQSLSSLSRLTTDVSPLLAPPPRNLVSKLLSSRSKPKCLDDRQLSLLGAGRLIAMTFLRRTSRPRQVLTDKQRAMSCQKLKMTPGTKCTGVHTNNLFIALALGHFAPSGLEQ